MVAEERGFIMLEVLAAGLALLVMASCLLLFARSMELRAADGCRVRAIFLARTQFASAQADANEGRLALGGYPWQGEAGDLQEGGIDYTVETNISGAPDAEGTAGLYRVAVQVAWQGETAKGKLELEREVVRHGQGE